MPYPQKPQGYGRQEQRRRILADKRGGEEDEPASPQYTGHSAGLHGEDQPHVTTSDMHTRLMQARPPQERDDYEAGSFIATMTKRYNGVVMPDGVMFRDGNGQVYVHRGPRPVIDRASRTQAQLPPSRKTDEIPVDLQKQQKQRRGRRLHWLFFVGLGLMAMVLGYVSLNAFGSWWHTHNDDLNYGRPRTFQTDAVVGHGDSPEHPSHFIAINLNRHIVIIEIPGGDPSRSLIYSGGLLVGDGQDLAPVTLSFVDTHGTGKPDMVIHVADQTITFTNNGTKFVPPPNLVRGESTLPTVGE